MSYFLNPASLALGFIAWAIPLIAMKKARKGQPPTSISIASFSACAMALLLQLFEIKRRVALQDFSAVMDTIGAICGVSVLLLLVTIVLNILVAIWTKEV